MIELDPGSERELVARHGRGARVARKAQGRQGRGGGQVMPRPPAARSGRNDAAAALLLLGLDASLLAYGPHVPDSVNYSVGGAPD